MSFGLGGKDQSVGERRCLRAFGWCADAGANISASVGGCDGIALVAIGKV
ncbi:hypothetical protein AF72_10030 [Xylella taiwanensis]|uniref:Uncharacterized protein n=1 Tax=Xylella taiwanensis TaxID=1444770 RepID=Z9JIH9_9GAMM|nr:hypothetical protein AF72_10030 [Xylella taiwanensis]